MNFQILDADYKLIGEDEPVIRLFGRSDDGKSVCCLIPCFEPYFYVESKNPDATKTQLTENFPQIVRIESVQKFAPVGYQVSQKPYLKIIVKAPKNVPEIRDDVAKLQDVTALFESDILFRNRFLVDNDIGGFQWVFAEEDPSLDREHYLAEVPIKADVVICTKTVKSSERISNAPLRYLSFDIECLPDNGNMPTPEKSPVVLVSFAFEPAWDGLKNLVYVGKNKPEGFNCDLGEANEGTIWVENEIELLSKTFETINRYDPDFITGYNISDFDIPYLLKRADVLKRKSTSLKTGIARDSSPIYSRKFGLTVKTEVTGRIVSDVLPLIRRNYSLKQYTLRNAAKELLGREKLDVSPAEMEAYWKDKGEKLADFIRYSRRDADLAIELLLNLKILDKYIALARITNSVIQEILDGGQTSMVEQVMLKEYGRHQRLMPIKPDGEMYEERDSEDEGLKGGAVLDPVRGLHENIILLDYKSLYPTIMMAHNLCYTTVISSIKDLDALGLKESDVEITPTGGIFAKSSVLKGIVPSILEDLLNRRVETKKKMKQTADEHEILALDATQMALKILLNSYYGYSGYVRARLYSMDMANSVTSIGRENILNTEKIITEDINKIYIYENKALLLDEIRNEFTSKGLSVDSDFDSGSLSDLDRATLAKEIRIVLLSVVYGDTDSVFMHCASESGDEFGLDDFTLEEAALVGSRASSIVTASLPSPMELEFEAVARRAVLIAKKRYAQWVFERSGSGWTDKIKVKGMETVRRDWCELTSETLMRVLEFVLMKGDVEEAVRYVRTVISDIRSIDLKKDPEFINKLILTKNYSKSTDNYKNRQPHLTVVEKIKQRTGISTPVGTRVPFVIISGKNLFVERAEDPDFVIKHNVPLDVEYYIKKQILPPVERIFEVFGVDVSSLDKYRQKGLFDFAESESDTPNIPLRKTETTSQIPTKDDGADTGPSKSSAYKEEIADDTFDSSVSFLDESEEKSEDESTKESEKESDGDSIKESEKESGGDSIKESEKESEGGSIKGFENNADSGSPQENTTPAGKKKPQKSLFDF